MKPAADERDTPMVPEGSAQGGGPLSVTLAVLAAAVIVASIAAGLFLVWQEASTQETFSAARLLGPIALLVGGLSVGGVLAACVGVLAHLRAMNDAARSTALDLAHMVRQADEIARRVRQDANPHVNPVPPDSDSGRQRDLQMISLLRDIAEHVQLSDRQREQRRLRAVSRAAADMVAAFEQHLANAAWHSARQTLADLEMAFPELPELPSMRTKLADAVTAAEFRDVATTNTQVDEWIAAGQWDRARQAVELLREKHPASQGAAALAAKVERAHEEHEANQRRELLETAEKAAAERRWSTALRAAQEFLAKFPTGPHAERVRTALPTIRDNAEIQYRQEVEEEIKHLIGRRDYVAALAAARELVARYPASPQAAVLRPQMERLKQLAHMQETGQELPTETPAPSQVPAAV